MMLLNGMDPDGYKYYYLDFTVDIWDTQERILTDEELLTIEKVCDVGEVREDLNESLYRQCADIYAYLEDMPFEVCRFSVICDVMGDYYVKVPDLLHDIPQGRFDEQASGGYVEYIYKKAPQECIAILEALMSDADTESWNSSYD